jgi:uncharacterized protein YozE (UPF0346 family)
MNPDETYSDTAPFLPNDIQRPPRNAPSDSTGRVMVLSAEYYLDAHRNEIICHQVWKSPAGTMGAVDEVKVRILTNVGTGWIVGGGSDEFVTYTDEEARRCWNHAVDNGATRVYKRANASVSSKYGMTADSDAFQESVYQKTLDKFANLYKYDEDPKSYKELAEEDRVWENYALEA